MTAQPQRPLTKGDDHVATFDQMRQTLSVSSTTVPTRSTQLAPGVYRVICDAPCFWLQGTVAVTPVGTGNFLPANTFHPDRILVVDNTNYGYIAVVGLTSAATNLYVMRVD